MINLFFRQILLIAIILTVIVLDSDGQSQGVIISPEYKGYGGCNSLHGKSCSFPLKDADKLDDKIEAKMFLRDGNIEVEFYKDQMHERTRIETFGKDFYRLENDIFLKRELCERLMGKDTTIIWPAGYYPVIESDTYFKLVFKL